MTGHTDRINYVLFSPNSTRIISCSYNSQLRLCNGVTGASIGVPMDRHTAWINGVPLSPDGTCIVSWSSDGTLRLRDVTGTNTDDPMNGINAQVSTRSYSPIRYNVNARGIWVNNSSVFTLPDPDFEISCWMAHEGRIALGSSDGKVVVIDFTPFLSHISAT